MRTRPLWGLTPRKPRVWLILMNPLRALAALAVFAVSLSTLSAKPDGLTSLPEALDLAARENKALFVMFGRENCGNCKALKTLLDKNAMRLPKSAFVVVDLNCDDPETSRLFREKFQVEGSTLPFVVIAKPSGEQVAARSGGGNAADYNEFIRKARKSAGGGS